MRTAVVLGALLIIGCDGSSSFGPPADAGSDAASDSGSILIIGVDGALPPTTNDAATGTGSSAACDAYIACVADTTPQELAGILAAYGKDGSCWKQGDTSLCDGACRTGTIAQHKLYPNAASCNTCATNADCPSSMPACDPSTSKCVECGVDSDCKKPGLAGCDVTTHTCVACTTDAECMNDPGKPRCDVATHACVACETNADCLGEVCDPTTKQCRQCQVDGECAPGVCNQGNCVQCRTDAQCGGATPHCGPNGACIQCVSDSECAPGICSAVGACCGATACAAINAQCGEALDLACILNPIPCGACTTGNVCVSNQCKPAPMKTCSAATCSHDCTFVPQNDDYECLVPGSCTQSTSCAQGFFCAETQFQGMNYYDCRIQCLDDTDCSPSHGTCVLIEGPTSWGYCSQ
jgi:hypothetical protein